MYLIPQYLVYTYNIFIILDFYRIIHKLRSMHLSMTVKSIYEVKLITNKISMRLMELNIILKKIEKTKLDRPCYCQYLQLYENT